MEQRPSAILRVPLVVLQGALAVLAIVSGGALLLNGAELTPEHRTSPDSVGLDSLLRFEGGVWTGLGLVLAITLHRIERQGPALRAAWIIALMGGLAHCFAVQRFGSSSPELRLSAYVEVLAPILLGLWQLSLAVPAPPPQRPRRRALLLGLAVAVCAALALYIGARAIAAGAPLAPTLASLPESGDLRGALFFIAGVWLGLGMVLASCAPALAARGGALRVACLLLLAGGLGRLLGLLRLGSFGDHVPVVIALEILLPALLLAWHAASRITPPPQPRSRLHRGSSTPR